MSIVADKTPREPVSAECPASRMPPRKRVGQGVGARSINGALLDVRATAQFIGGSEKQVRGMVERRLIPFKRMGNRIVFLRRDIEAWLMALDGCSVESALENMARRRGAFPIHDAQRK
jgi:hypothetical protein